MQCFILAGGFATRLWPLTERRAKPLLPLAGKPILSHLAEKIPAGLPVTVSTNAVFADDVRRWAASVKGHAITVRIEDVGHENHKLGALGAVAEWITEEKIDEDVLLLAGDNYCECDLGRFAGLFRGKPLIAAHDVGDPDRARQFGTIILDPAGDGVLKTVLEFEEKPANPQSSCVSTGWWLLPKDTLPILVGYSRDHPDNVGGIFEELRRRGLPIDCFVFRERWKDIGSFGSYMAIHRDVVGDRRMIDPKTTVDDTTTLTGSIAAGPDCTITGSVLTDCILFGDSVIDDCVLSGCIIDGGCMLKGVDLTGKMLRAGTVLKRSLP